MRNAARCPACLSPRLSHSAREWERCRGRARRRWKRGLAATAFPAGSGRRGPIPMGASTARERERDAARERGFVDGFAAGKLEGQLGHAAEALRDAARRLGADLERQLYKRVHDA